MRVHSLRIVEVDSVKEENIKLFQILHQGQISQSQTSSLRK